MIENKSEELERSRITYETLEEHVRMKAQRFIQEILEGEVNHFLGKRKSERIKKGTPPEMLLHSY
jgi:hypothetical protein|tara:strand:- start:330 stop:524 length:195 start_codon:yes stop_codon:yes gene_type:complete